MKKWLKQEKNKLHGLTASQKLRYVWDYYKLWIIGIVALFMFSGYIVTNYRNANRDNHIYVAFVNTMADLGEGSDFWEGYVSCSGVDVKKETVTFDTENYFDMSKNNVTGNHYYEKVVVLIDSKTADALVMETKNLVALGRSGRLIDLNNEKTKQLMERYSDRLITTEVADEDGTTREVPVGIDISDSRLVTQDRAYEECALGISETIDDVQAVEEFLTYLIGE